MLTLLECPFTRTLGDYAAETEVFVVVLGLHVLIIILQLPIRF